MALPEESKGEMEKITANILYTGIGKVNAAIRLSQALCEGKYEQVINLGSAGSHHFSQLDMVQCTRFIQHDMNAQVFGYAPFQTPQEEKIILESHDFKTDLQTATLYTGDQFVSDARLNYAVIDMEGYALAKICAYKKLPFLCIKFISDNANEASKYSWGESLAMGSKKLAEFLHHFYKRSV